MQGDRGRVSVCHEAVASDRVLNAGTRSSGPEVIKGEAAAVTATGSSAHPSKI